jgi:hypothetical protein
LNHLVYPYISGPKRNEITEGWRRLHKTKLYHLNTSENITQVIKSRRLRWARHVARRGREAVHTAFWWEILRKEDHLEEPGEEGRILLQWILKKWNGKTWTRSMSQDRDRWRAVVNAVMNLPVL